MENFISNSSGKVSQESGEVQRNIALLFNAALSEESADLICNLQRTLSDDIDFTFIAVSEGFESPSLQKLKQFGLEILFVPPSPSEIRKKLCDLKIEVVHTVDTDCDHLASSVVGSAAVKWIRTLAQNEKSEKSGWFNFFSGKRKEKAAAVVARNSDLFASIKSEEVLSRHVVISNATAWQNDEVDRLPNIKKSEVRIYWYGEVAEKNLDIFLRALTLVSTTRPKFKLVVCGQSNLLEKIKIQAPVEWKLDTRLSDVAEDFLCDELRASQIYLNFSDKKGVSLRLLQAMRAGLAVISADSILPEDFVSEKNVLYFNKNDVLSVSLVLTRLYDDPSLISRLGAAAKDLFAQKFSFDQVIDKYRTLYRMV